MIGFEIVNAKFFRSLDENALREDEQTKGNQLIAFMWMGLGNEKKSC